MSIGATSTFTQTRDEICTDALINLGAVAPGKDASAARTAGLLAHAARALNRLVKAMDADGEYLWRVARQTFNTDDLGAGGFQLPMNAIDVDEPMSFEPDITDPGHETLITAMSRDEYMAIADKDETGTPTRFLFEHGPLSVASVDCLINLHPTPDAGVLPNWRISYAAVLRAADFTAGADTPDFPSKWISCLVYGLTAELAPTYNQSAKLPIFRGLFNDEKARLLADAGERGNMRLVPFGAMRY